jgi:hypothetical protein
MHTNILRKARGALFLLVLAAAWPAAGQLDLPDEEEETFGIELSRDPLRQLDPEEQIRTLLELGGLAARVRQIPHNASQQAIAAIGGDTGSSSQHFAQLFAEEFDPESILQGIVDQLVSSYDRSAAGVVLDWYRSPTGKKVGAAIATAHSPDGQGQLTAFARRSQSQSPTALRQQLAVRLDEATETSQEMIALTAETNLSLTIALNRLQGVKVDPDRASAAIHRRLSARIPLEARTYLRFVTRTLSTDEVEQYIAFSQSDPARWFRRTSRAGYQQRIAAALAAFTTRFYAWMEQRDLPQSREEAAADGRLFGARRLDQECLPQALRRDSACEDVVCEASTATFLSKCLDASHPTPEQCTQVPTSSDMRVSLQWQLKVCGRFRRADRFCRALMRSLQAHCERRKQPTAAEPS